MTVAFTGRRPHGLPWGYDESSEKALAFRSDLSSLIRELAESHGADTFYTGMAEGIDMMAAEAVLDLRCEHSRIRLLCALPFDGQSRRWSDAQRARYNSILSASDGVHCLSPVYTPSCMMLRNIYMVDHSDALAAVWDGKMSGGTFNTYSYAVKQGKRVVVLDPYTLRQLWR